MDFNEDFFSTKLERRNSIFPALGEQRKAFCKALFVALFVVFALILAILVLSGTFDKTESGTEKTRVYYIAANPIIWNYCPSSNNPVSGKPFTSSELLYVDNTDKTIGKLYKKAVYQQYTDETFKYLIPVDYSSSSKGLLGPTLRGAVGDTIKVIFKNNVDFPCSVHPHGLQYSKSSEGVFIMNGESIPSGGSVKPGEIYTYTWNIPDSAGPGPDDTSSIGWPYHSSTNEVKDTNSGLIGTILVARKEAALESEGAVPNDIDAEFIANFATFDENESHYLDENIQLYLDNNTSIKNDPIFIESNKKTAINGKIFASLPEFQVRSDETVRWYLTAMGDDFYGAHLLGHTVLYNNHRTDVVELLPGTSVSVDMITDNVGVWAIRGHKNAHIESGMIAFYNVSL